MIVSVIRVSVTKCHDLPTSSSILASSKCLFTLELKKKNLSKKKNTSGVY